MTKTHDHDPPPAGDARLAPAAKVKPFSTPQRDQMTLIGAPYNIRDYQLDMLQDTSPQAQCWLTVANVQIGPTSFANLAQILAPDVDPPVDPPVE